MRCPTVLRPRALSRVLVASALAAACAAAGGSPPPSRATPRGPAPALLVASLLPGSAITVRAHDQLHTFTGHAPIATFRARLDPAHPATASGSLTVRANSITTGNFIRDLNARRGVFEADRYPVIRFALRRVTARPAVLADGGTSRVTVTGQLTMHGVRRQVTATGTVQRRGPRLALTLTLPLRLSAFGMPQPRLFTVVVADTVQVKVALSLGLRRAPGP